MSSYGAYDLSFSGRMSTLRNNGAGSSSSRPNSATRTGRGLGILTQNLDNLPNQKRSRSDSVNRGASIQGTAFPKSYSIVQHNLLNNEYDDNDSIPDPPADENGLEENEEPIRQPGVPLYSMNNATSSNSLLGPRVLPPGLQERSSTADQKLADLVKRHDDRQSLLRQHSGVLLHEVPSSKQVPRYQLSDGLDEEDDLGLGPLAPPSPKTWRRLQEKWAAEKQRTTQVLYELEQEKSKSSQFRDLSDQYKAEFAVLQQSQRTDDKFAMLSESITGALKKSQQNTNPTLNNKVLQEVGGAKFSLGTISAKN